MDVDNDGDLTEAAAPKVMNESDLVFDDDLFDFIMGEVAESASAEPVSAQELFSDDASNFLPAPQLEIRQHHSPANSRSSSCGGSSSSSAGGSYSGSGSGDETSDCQTPSSLSLPFPRRDRRSAKSRRRTKPTSFKETTNGALALVSKKQTIFPNFEKSDTLLYLPKVICQCLNEGNFDQMRSTIFPRSNKDCEVLVHSTQQLQCGPESIVRFFEQMLTFHPDMVCCNTGITSKESTLTAQFSFKRTSIQRLFSRLSDTPSHKQLFAYGAKSRATWLDLMEWSPHQTEDDKRDVADLLQSREDLETYGVGYVTLFFDNKKRICKFQTHCKLISISKLKSRPGMEAYPSPHSLY